MTNTKKVGTNRYMTVEVIVDSPEESQGQAATACHGGNDDTWYVPMMADSIQKATNPDGWPDTPGVCSQGGKFFLSKKAA